MSEQCSPRFGYHQLYTESCKLSNRSIYFSKFLITWTYPSTCFRIKKKNCRTTKNMFFSCTLRFRSENFFNRIGHFLVGGKSYWLASRHADDWRMRSGRVLCALDAFWMGEISWVRITAMLNSSISVAIELIYYATLGLCIFLCVFVWLLFELFNCRITV